MGYQIIRAPDDIRFQVTKFDDVTGATEAVPDSIRDTYEHAVARMRELYLEDGADPVPFVPMDKGIDAESGAMIAIFLPGDTAIQLHTATLNAGLIPESVNNLHVTLIYLGEVASLTEKKSAILNVLRHFCAIHTSLSGMVNGMGRFQGQDPNPIFANFDSAMLPEYRQQLLHELERVGVNNEADHGFTPHVTLAYLATTAPTPTVGYEPLSVNVGTLTLAWGNERIDIELAATQNKGLLTQAQVAYTPQSNIPNQMCLTCLHYHTEQGQIGACDAIENGPLPIVAQGWCRQWNVKEGQIAKGLNMDEFWKVEEKGGDPAPMAGSGPLLPSDNFFPLSMETKETFDVPADAVVVPIQPLPPKDASFWMQPPASPAVQTAGTESPAVKAWTWKAAMAPTDPALYAYVPEKDKPSTWKLRIDDKKHVGLAIAALSRSNAPHGQPAKIPPDARAGVIRKISGRIGTLDIPDAEKQDLRDRLATFQGKELSKVRQFVQLLMGGVKSDPGATVTADASALNGPMLDGSGTFGVFSAPGVNRSQLRSALARSGRAYVTPRAKYSQRREVGLYIDKGLDGRRLMFLITSNSYQDREDETIMTKALKRYVDAAWTVEGKCMPHNPLLLWHKGSPIGDIVWCDMEGPFLIEVAKERANAVVNLNNPEERPLYTTIKAAWDLMEAEAKKEAWGASHGFEYPRDTKSTDGMYDTIYKFETSALPLRYAANAITLSALIEGVTA